MTIQNRFQLIFGVLLAAMALASAINIWAMGTVDRVSEVEVRRLQSVLLADELRQSSDDQTRMARSFAATRDGRYERYFQDILDIRSGDIPYPAGYQGIFWDFVIPENKRLDHKGTSISLRDRMRQLGFTDQEFAKLKQAEENSDDLVNLEAVAMNAVVGRFDNGDGSFSEIGAPDQRMAMTLLFGDDYHQAKAKIMRPVQEFFDLLQARTSAEIDDIHRQSEIAAIVAMIVTLATFGVSGWAFFQLRSTVIAPLATLRDGIEEFRLTRSVVDVRNYTRKDEIGEIARGFDATAREISTYIENVNEAREELAQGERDLRDREERIRSLLEVSPIGFMLVRFDGEILFTNDALRRILQTPDNASLDLDVAKLYQDPADREHFLEALAESGEVSGLEFAWKRHDGSPFWVTLSSKIIDYDGRKAILGWIDDITERKKTEEEIAAKEALLRLSFDTMADGIYVLDRNLDYQFFNDQYVNMVDLPEGAIATGASVENAIRAHAERGDYGTGAIDTMVQQRLDRLASDEHIQSEMTIDGGRRMVDLRKVGIPGGGAVVVATDVTERKQVEALQIAQLRSLELLHEIGDAIQDAETLEDAYEACLHKLCEHMDWPIGHVFVPDRANVDVLVSAKVWHMDAAFDLEEFRRTSEGISFGRGEGLPGIVRESRRPGWISDVAQEPKFVRADVAMNCGILSGVAVPVTSERGTIAVIECFSAEEYTPDDHALTILANVGSQLGSAILRKQAEAKLAHQMTILETTLESMDQGISMLDADLRVMARNSRFVEMLEFPPEQFPIGIPLENMFRYNAERGEYGEGNIDEQVASRLALARKFEAHRFERTRPDGMVMEIRGNPLPDKQGFVTTYTDITSRKKAEQEIAAKEAQLRMVLDNMPGTMWLVDSDLRLVFANDQYIEYYGDPGGIVAPGADMAEIVRQEAQGDLLGGEGDIEEIVTTRIESYKSKTSTTFEDKTPDGRYIHLQRKPIEDGYVISVGTDITERKRAEEETARQKELSETILESMDQAIYMVDQDFKFSAYNTKFREIMKFPDGEYGIGTPLLGFFRYNAERGIYGDGDPEQLAAETMDRARNVERYTIERTRPDGSAVEMKRSPVPSGGLVMIISDITERKQSERIIADAMSLIHESIQYASRIQRSVLPSAAEMSAAFGEHCAVWEPKDVVGGDIYLLRQCTGGTLLAVIDCTGHGVPGAFMTMIATGALDQALIEIPEGDPARLLTRVNQLVKTTLGQEGDDGESDDGFECGLCLLRPGAADLIYAGARFELWCVADEMIEVVKGDKAGIGYRRTDATRAFTNHSVPLGDAMAFYIVTDGIIDQVGGPKGRAFGKRRAQAAIVESRAKKMETRAAHVLQAFADYQGDQVRRDDVTLVGFRPNT